MLQSNLAAIALEISDSGASGMEHSSTRHGAQPTATNRPDPPTLEDISNFVAEGIRDNTFSTIMELVKARSTTATTCRSRMSSNSFLADLDWYRSKMDTGYAAGTVRESKMP